MTIQRNSNHILDLNRILKRKPHKFDGEEGSSRIFTGTSDGPSNEVLTTNNNNSLSNLAPIKSDNINYNPNDGYKTYKVDPDGTEKSNLKEPEGKKKITGSQVSGAISTVAGGLAGMYAGYKGNSTIADTSGYKKQANSIANSSSSAETNDALLNDMNSFNPMNSVSYGQVRGASNGDMAKNTLNSVVSGASAGSVAGPWGAAIGAVVGLGTGVAGIFSGNSKAKREKRRLNGQIAAANQSAINNFANTASNINTNTNINLGRNYFAQGGHLFEDGNNVHVGVPSMLAARNESKPYLPTVTKQTMKTGKVYNYYDSDHDKKPVKKVHTKSLVGNQVFIPLSPYQWTKDYVNSDVFKNRLANIFNYRNDANDELYNEVKHNIDNVGIFNVDMKKPTSYFINRLPSNASGAIYNHRRYDGYGNDAASFYDPVENIVINDVSKQKDKRFDNGDYYDRAIPHELGHTMDPHFDLSHAQYFSKDIFGHKYIDDGVSFYNNRHSYQQLYDAHKSNPFINFEHESYSHENYADIHALRYNLYKFGIKDIANGDVITKSDLTKYKKIISKLPAGPRNVFSRIFSVFDDGVIINMLNKRASNDTNKQSSIKQNIFAEGGHIFKNGGKANKTSKSKNAKHVVLQTDYTKPVIDNDGRVFYPFSSGVVVDDKSSGLKPEIGKSGFVEHDVNQTLSGIQFDKNGNVVKNTYKESPSVNDDTRIPITSSPSVLPNGERRKEPYEPTDEQQYYRHVTNGDDVDLEERSMAAGLALAGIPFGGWVAAALNVPQALYTWKHRDETNGVNKFLDYASVIPGMKFTKALNLSTNPAIIRSARLAARVTKKAHPADITIKSKKFAAPVAALQVAHKAGDAQNVLTYPSLVKDWFNRQLIDTRFDNYLDSSVKPLILNKFADGGDIDEKKAVETPGQWERRYVNSPEFEKRYKSILYHGADVPSLQDIRDQVNNTHYLHVNFDNGMGSRQMVPLNVRTNVADTYDYGLRHKNEFELSHYVKPVGKGNPWIVEDTRPYPATADFTKDNVMPHEHGHVIDFNNYLSTAEYNDDGSTQPDPKYMFDANRKPIDKANSSISYSHDSKEAENYADINALKYNLYKFGIKDIANGDIVTIDDIRKFKDIINKMPVKQRNAYNRIFYLFDDDAIVRFLNKLADSNNHPDVNVPSVNVFAEGGDLDYDAIKQSYNDSNTGYSKFNHSSGWIKDYMRDHMKTGLVADGSVDAATMKGIKKANMNMNMFYTANGTDGEEMSNNVDYGWVKKNNPSQLYQYENQNLPTNGDKVQQSNLGSSTSSKAAKKAAPINVSKSKFYANIQQETKANPQLNETMSIAYNYLIKKGFKPVNASAIVGCIYAESRMNPQQDNDDHCGLLQWTKFKTENNKKKFGDRYNKLIEHTKQLEGDKYKDGDENLLLNQLAFIADDLRSKDFNNDKVKLIHTLSKSQSIYDSAKAIMEIYGGDDKDKYSPTERAAYALYCLKNISTMKQDNNKDKK